MGSLGDIFWGSVGKTLEDSRFKWYDLAASRCIDVIDGKIDRLNARLTNGELLNEKEQFLLGKLHELKREILEDLREGAREVTVPM